MQGLGAGRAESKVGWWRTRDGSLVQVRNHSSTYGDGLVLWYGVGPKLDKPRELTFWCWGNDGIHGRYPRRDLIDRVYPPM